VLIKRASLIKEHDSLSNLRAVIKNNLNSGNDNVQNCVHAISIYVRILLRGGEALKATIDFFFEKVYKSEKAANRVDDYKWKCSRIKIVLNSSNCWL
jgi:hypothetical protein